MNIKNHTSDCLISKQGTLHLKLIQRELQRLQSNHDDLEIYSNLMYYT